MVSFASMLMGGTNSLFGQEMLSPALHPPNLFKSYIVVNAITLHLDQ